MDSQVGDEGMVRLASAIGAHHIRFQQCRRTQVGRAGAQALLDAGINVDGNRLPFGQELRQTRTPNMTGAPAGAAQEPPIL